MNRHFSAFGRLASVPCFWQRVYKVFVALAQDLNLKPLRAKQFGMIQGLVGMDCVVKGPEARYELVLIFRLLTDP